MSAIIIADMERVRFKVGERVRIDARQPFGHYRVPLYLRGKQGVIEAVVEPAALDNEEEGFGRDAGMKQHYYRLAFALTELWPQYAAGLNDTLRIEVYENWLERI